jgi:hypothetical protein
MTRIAGRTAWLARVCAPKVWVTLCAVSAAALVGAPTQPAAAATTHAKARTPSIVLGGSASVYVGGRIELTLRAHGAQAVRGFETRLVYDTRAAELVTLANEGLPQRSTTGGVRELGPIDLPVGVAFGSYSTIALSNGTGDSVVARITLRATHSGLISFRLLGTKLVDAGGRQLPLRAGGQVVRVQVGSARRRVDPAPISLRLTALHAVASPRATDITGDRRLTRADVTEAELN